MSGVEQLRRAALVRRDEVSQRLDTSPTAMQTSLDKVLVRAAMSGTTGIGAAALVPQSTTTPPVGASGTGTGPWVAGMGLLLGGGLLIAAVATSANSNASDTAISSAAPDVTIIDVATPAVVPTTAPLTSGPVVDDVSVDDVAADEASVDGIPVAEVTGAEETVDGTQVATTVAPLATEIPSQAATTIPAPVLIADGSDANDASSTGGGVTTGGGATGGNDDTGTDTGSDSGGATAAGTDTSTGIDSTSTAGLDSGTGGDAGSDTGSATTGEATGGTATGGTATGGDTTGGDDRPPPPPSPPSSTCGSTAGLPAGAAAVIEGGGDFDGDGEGDVVGLYNTVSGVAVVVDRSSAGLSDVGFVGEKPLSDLSSTASVRTAGIDSSFGIIFDDLDDDGSTVWLRPFAVSDCAVTALELPTEPGEPDGDLWGGSGYTFEGRDFGLQCVTEGDATIVTFLSDSEVGARVAFDPAEPSLSFDDGDEAMNQGCWK